MQTIQGILDRAATRTWRSTTAEPESSSEATGEYAPPPERCICGGGGFFRVDVEVGHPWFGKAHPCVCSLQRKAKRYHQWLWDECRLPEHFRQASLEDFDGIHPGNGKVRNAAIEFATGELATPWLAVFGQYGNGKSHIAAALVRSFVLRNVHAVYAYAPAVLKELQRAIQEDKYHVVLNFWQRVPVLAIDDFGLMQETPWAREQWDELVDYRYRETMPTVLTTNLSIQDVEAVSPRIARRIRDSRICTVVVNDAPQWRWRKVG